LVLNPCLFPSPQTLSIQFMFRFFILQESPLMPQMKPSGALLCSFFPCTHPTNALIHDIWSYLCVCPLGKRRLRKKQDYILLCFASLDSKSMSGTWKVLSSHWLELNSHWHTGLIYVLPSTTIYIRTSTHVGVFRRMPKYRWFLSLALKIPHKTFQNHKDPWWISNA
jgi:hypothetical protein